MKRKYKITGKKVAYVLQGGDRGTESYFLRVFSQGGIKDTRAEFRNNLNEGNILISGSCGICSYIPFYTVKKKLIVYEQ